MWTRGEFIKALGALPFLPSVVKGREPSPEPEVQENEAQEPGGVPGILTLAWGKGNLMVVEVPEAQVELFQGSQSVANLDGFLHHVPVGPKEVEVRVRVPRHGVFKTRQGSDPLPRYPETEEEPIRLRFHCPDWGWTLVVPQVHRVERVNYPEDNHVAYFFQGYDPKRETSL